MLFAQIVLTLTVFSIAFWLLYEKHRELKEEFEELRAEISETQEIETNYQFRSGFIEGFNEYLIVSFDRGSTWRNAVEGADGLEPLDIANPELLKMIDAMQHHAERLERQGWLHLNHGEDAALFADAGISPEHRWN